MKYPESKLTYKIIGIAYEIYNKIGPGYVEKVYQNAFEEKLKENKINYKREIYCNLQLDNKNIGKFFLDFLIENKVILETKSRNEIFKKDVAQILNYLRLNKIKLGLVILFSSTGVKIKRIIL
jgi:GxxExxY protein